MLPTGYQNNKLREAIEKSFDKGRLERLLKDNYEKLKIENLDNLPFIDNAYESKIQALIDRLKEDGLINEFLIVASIACPQGKITDFDQYYKIYCDYEFYTLISMWKKIEKEDKIIAKFKKSSRFERSFSNHKTVYEQFLKRKILPIDDIIYNWFSQSPNINNDIDDSDESILKVQDFVNFLTKDLNIREFDENHFEEWTNNLNLKGIDFNDDHNYHQLYDRDYHLLIIIQPKSDQKENEGKKYIINAELYPPVVDIELGFNNDCSLNEIPNEIYNFIKVLNDEGIAFNTIKLFLDHNLLGTTIDTSMKKYKVKRKHDNTYMVIPANYKFVACSIKRLTDKIYKGKLKSERDNLSQASIVDIKDITNLVKKIDKARLETNLLDNSQKKIIGYICSQPENTYNNNFLPRGQQKCFLFNTIFAIGTPLCIWMDNRTYNHYKSLKIDNSNETWELKVNKILHDENITFQEKINKVLKEIMYFRIKMYNINTYDPMIGVLCDDPDIIPITLKKITPNFSNS